MLKGHTSAIIGLMLHLESGTYIFSSEVVNSIRN
jgi:hypothetical protein